MQAQFDAGIPFGKGAEQRRQHVGGKQHRSTQRQHACDALLRVIQILSQVRFNLQHLLCCTDVGSAGTRQSNGRSAAVKDRRADTGLGLADHLT